MNEKIKAILIQNGEPTPENPIEIKRLLVNKEAEDYITNLQKENENKDNKILELQQELLNKKLNVKDIEYKEKMIYKSRIDKAIEYITNEKHKQTAVGKYTKDIHKNLLKILRGDEE